MKRPPPETHRATTALVLVGLATAAAAQGPLPESATPLNMNLFVQALVNGRAAEPLAQRPEWDLPIQQIQRATGSKAPLELRAMRVARFAQQPQCGRVEFGLWQPATRQVIAQVGGQLNVCIDGKPPLQECRDKPGVLVPVGFLCPGGDRARDTQEVRDALEGALRAGGRTPEDIKRELAAAGVSRSAAAPTGGKP